MSDSATNVPDDLLIGYQRFRVRRFPRERERYSELAEDQSPRTMVIGCADSRVDPATIFSAGPGELFVVRNVAALVPPCEEKGTFHGTSAAVEFAVAELGVEKIVVMGHGRCGGITAALRAADNRPVGKFIGPWVGLLDDVRDHLLMEKGPEAVHEHQRALEHLAVRLSLYHLEGYPFVAEAIEAGKVTLHGAWFSIAEAELDWLDRSTGTFHTVRSQAEGADALATGDQGNRLNIIGG